MRVGLLSLTLIIVIFAGAPGNLAPTTRIVSAQSSQPRNQTQPQDGLRPDQKRSLSKYGPEDYFGPSAESRETNSIRNPPVKPTQRSPRTTSVFPIAPSPRPPATSAPAPSETPSETPLQATETPSPTIPVASFDSGGIQQPPLGQGDPSATVRWTAPFFVLLALALIVLAALIFTLNKLWEKIRESSA